MPVYFFHVSRGNRLLPDEDGTELRNRVAAREEAFSVASDLCHGVAGYDRRHWANCFLVVADADGSFLRIPIAPEGPTIVAPGHAASTSEQFTPSGTLPGVASVRLGGRVAKLIQQTEKRRHATRRLMERQRVLRNQLRGQLASTEQALGEASQALARARLVGSALPNGVAATTDKPEAPQRPRLTVLPGGKT